MTASSADDRRTTLAAELMAGFAERTGLTAAREPRRYLWTDAFAVCNYVALARATGDARHADRALRLVGQVHHTLGRHRGDDGRTGWISGLAPDEGEAHPTRGGLRIGKRLPEREPGERFDERLEWDRDGQYFHYLTKWMHALDRAAGVAGEPTFAVWARELAAVAHRAFVHAPAHGARMRMYWKMSIDLSRPQVPSMGHHDPLDGYVTCRQLDATRGGRPTAGPRLDEAAADFAAMIDRDALATDDPLGLGGLLVDAARLAQLPPSSTLPSDEGLLEALLGAAVVGLGAWARGGDLRAPARRRLAFRELGLAIGLAGLDLVAARTPRSSAIASRLEMLRHFVPLRDAIESFWLRSENRRVDTWVEHADIDEVMLATSLVPDGLLVLAPR